MRDPRQRGRSRGEPTASSWRRGAKCGERPSTRTADVAGCFRSRQPARPSTRGFQRIGAYTPTKIANASVHKLAAPVIATA